MSEPFTVNFQHISMSELRRCLNTEAKRVAREQVKNTENYGPDHPAVKALDAYAAGLQLEIHNISNLFLAAAQKPHPVAKK